MDTQQSLTIGIVAGEKSGDLLGAGLISALKKRYNPVISDIRFIGLGGEAMIAEGLTSIDDMELLSVMGFIEPLKRLPQLFKLRANLLDYFIKEKVDIAIGIDSPDFTLGLEKRLKKRGIRTCHYVCPSVWAWRQWRVKKLKACTDHILTLFPFESDFLKKHDIESTFVGHPLADQLYSDTEVYNKNQLCVMPGSRQSEVKTLLPIFLKALLLLKDLDLSIVIPAASDEIEGYINQVLIETEFKPLVEQVKVVNSKHSGSSQLLMKESEVLLMASGTATLEAALLGKPAVVAYKMAWLTYQLVKRLVKIEYAALPNLLLKRAVMPEFIQDEAKPEFIAEKLRDFFINKENVEEVRTAFIHLKQALSQNANEQAASAIQSLLEN